MKLKLILENILVIPEILYHATYKNYIKKIKLYGLNSNIPKKLNWENSVRGYIYLANDPDVAISYAEESENVKDEWVDNIYLLTINTNGLDKNKFYPDSNVLDDDSTYEYRGIIPPKFIINYKKITL